MSRYGCSLVRHTMFLIHVLSNVGTERMVESEPPQVRAIALFGLYTFYFTQPSGTAPALRRVTHIPIPLGARYLIMEKHLCFADKLLRSICIPQSTPEHSGWGPSAAFSSSCLSPSVDTVDSGSILSGSVHASSRFESTRPPT
jgi:hypothetical protein